ncbi:hypothetical protein CLV71_11469 [Actinophytocola oryzae]|uniref:Uncharacterized protein n=2 Tax=Actinophytocola oryzae TaxID=502181 RepID=A0A4R7V5E5_9PSEU|nr:hypothetical protein CLV71_11469 [Actinophytocola oryzae]
MSALEVSASRYSLTVDATQTFESLSDVAENESGDRLRDALAMALTAKVTYATVADRVVTSEDIRPGPGDSPDLTCMSCPAPWSIVKTLESAGFLTAQNVLVELTGDTYLSEGRSVTIINVVKPFTVVTVDYGFSSSERWTATDQSDAVPAGWYLLGEVREHFDTKAIACAVGMNELPDDVVAWLFELEGFGASTCLAGCSSCGSQWRAESGDWTFHPDGCDVGSWVYDDADDFHADTIACPECETGRVGFTVH